MTSDPNEHIDLVVDRVDQAARRAEQALSELDATGAESFLVEAMKRAHDELEDAAGRLARAISAV